jgi:hypothetical protein
LCVTRYPVRRCGLLLHRPADLTRDGLHLYNRGGDTPKFTH